MENIWVKGAGAPERQAQVSDEINKSDSAIDQLNLAVSDLTERLNLVLRDSIPCDDCEKAPEDNLVPIADSIRQIRRRIITEAGRVRDVIGRIEI
jgi:hypothetical protein